MIKLPFQGVSHNRQTTAAIMQALHKLFLFCVLMSLGGNALGSEIINGKKTKQKSRLYMASVQNAQGHICGGFLISEDFVVTAAHCKDGNPTGVVLGTHDLNNVSAMQRYPVKKCIHPSYEGVATGNDIMLLKLEWKARLGKKKQIKPIKLPNKKMKLKEKKKCLAAGWGLTKTGGEVVNDLQEVEVPVINLEKCNSLWSNRLPAKVICAGGYDSKNGICQGDSGGPLVCDQKAVGVVSFNNGSYCDYPDIPNVYTDIFEFLPWIKGILKKKDC